MGPSQRSSRRRKIWFWKGCKPNSVCTLAGGENHLSERPIPETCPLSRNAERAAPRFPIWPCTRWGFPCRVACASRGGLLHHLFTLTSELALEGGIIFCGTVRRKAFQPSARVYPSQTDLGYAASRPMVFGLSSPDLRPERFSALPKPVIDYRIN